MKLKELLVALIMVVSTSSAFADPPIPTFNNTYVSDMAGVLSYSQKMMLNKRLRGLDESGRVVMVVVIVPTLDGRPIDLYTSVVDFHNNIGHPGKNDGVYLTISVGDENVYMGAQQGVPDNVTGSALQTVLNNAEWNFFRAGNYAGGIWNIVDFVDQNTQP